jgi:ApbE superfamily uncharacterized protein (UPF0280 family)
VPGHCTDDDAITVLADSGQGIDAAASAATASSSEPGR